MRLRDIAALIFPVTQREGARMCGGFSVSVPVVGVESFVPSLSISLLLKISTVFFHFVEKAICHPKRILFIIQFIVDLLHRFSLFFFWGVSGQSSSWLRVCVCRVYWCVVGLRVCVYVLCDVSVNEKKKEGKSLERCHDRLNGIALFSKKRLFGIRKLNNKWLPLLQLTRRWRPHPASSSCPTCPVYYFITGYWSAAASLNRHEVLVQPSFTVILYICRRRRISRPADPSPRNEMKLEEEFFSLQMAFDQLKDMAMECARLYRIFFLLWYPWQLVE